MNHLLLSIHVVAGIVFVGGSAVAASLFPRYAPLLTGGGEPVRAVAGMAGDRPNAATDVKASRERSRAVAVALHRVTGGYALLGLVVPVVGIALAVVQDRMGEIWITLAMVLTAAAGLLLATQIHPRQRDALDRPDDGRKLRTLAAITGVYNLVWTAVVVLMIVRPGSVAA
ncbi:hypothetical protein [Saccharothrix hoggarensis]|uniref:Integral membrane protein DUF2269 n=1 Tax=Saccharothrix hoggarensis TaxID=913853 RepID=A0ABW3R487_9PSEU